MEFILSKIFKRGFGFYCDLGNISKRFNGKRRVKNCECIMLKRNFVLKIQLKSCKKEKASAGGELRKLWSEQNVHCSLKTLPNLRVTICRDGSRF